METILEKLGWKKFAVIVVGVSLLFLFVVLLSLSNVDRKSVGTVDSKVNDGRSLTQADREGTILSKKYSSDYFSISYPENYELITLIYEFPLYDSIKLKEITTGQEIAVVVFDGSAFSIDELSSIYQNEDFTGRVFNNNGDSVAFFEGGFDASHHEKVAIVESNQKLVRVLLSYVGEENSSIEKDFDLMVDSLEY